MGCTGQRPNSSILESLLPNAISKETSRILVQPTLQVLAVEAPSPDTRTFAFGDVADHGGPYMARAGWRQSGVVLDNILGLIHGQGPSRTYKPDVFVEGAIKLTLGKTHNVVYSMEADGSDVMIPARNGQLDLGVKRAWWTYGANFKLAGEPAGGI
jgi:apoptosis-inducing factor 2